MTLSEDIERTFPNLTPAERHKVQSCIEMAADNACRQMHTFFGSGTSIDWSKETSYYMQGCLELLISDLQRRV